MVSTIVLVCGVLASLALGVLLAYGLCISMFGLLKMHARQLTPASVTPSTAIAPTAAPQLGTLSN